MDQLRTAVALAVVLVSGSAAAQSGTLGKEKVDNFYKARASNYAAEDEKCIANTDCNAILITASVPFAFSSLDFKGGTVSLGAKLQLGGAAALVIGKATRAENGKLTVSPIFTFGLSILGGAATTPTTGSVGGSFGLGAFFALGPLGVIGGYDFVQGSGFIGLSAKVDSFVVADGLTAILSLKRAP